MGLRSRGEAGTGARFLSNEVEVEIRVPRGIRGLLQCLLPKDNGAHDSRTQRHAATQKGVATA